MTDAAAQDMWNLTKMLLPGQVSTTTFGEVKGVIERAEVKYVQRYHVCPNDCIVYYDSKHLPEHYRHAHRTRYDRHKCSALSSTTFKPVNTYTYSVDIQIPTSTLLYICRHS